MTPSETAPSELQAVLANQQAQAAAQETATQLLQAIAAQQAKAELLRPLAAQIAALQTEREDLLADIATGQDKAAALTTLDAHLAQRQKDLAKQGTQAAIEQTVAGLTRKLERVQGELEGLQQERPGLMRRLILVRAEALGAKYVAATRQLQDLHDRLSGMCLVLSGQGQTEHIAPAHGLQVPVFSLDSVRPHAMALTPRLLVDTSRRMTAELAPAIGAEKAALRALGVEIS